jgi:hypothetical protein
MPAKQSEAWCKKAHDWSLADDELLTVLWAGDLTQAQIGKRLGVGKNSIHGRAKRLNLPPRMHLVAQRNPENCKKYATMSGCKRMMPAQLGLDRMKRERNGTYMGAPEQIGNDPKPIKYSREGCRWVLEMKPTRYCEEPALFNKSYCEVHHAIATRKDPNDQAKRRYGSDDLMAVG